MKLRAEDMFGPAGDPFDPAIEGSGIDREIVVWVDEEADLVALLHATGDGLPRLDRLSHVLTRIGSGGMILEAAARLNPAWLDRVLDDDDRAEREARMKAIRPLLSSTPDIFDPIKRGRLIKAAHVSSGRSVNSIKKWLKSFYRSGRCPNALLSRYEACGHRRKGVVGDHWKKLGRSSKKSGKRPENVTVSLRKEFATATERERAFTGEAFKISGAHRRWKEEFCHEMVEVDGKLTGRLVARYDDSAPATYRQFYDWYSSTGQHEVTSRKVLGEPIYEKDNRAIVSTSTVETWGPGARFQIDATVVNFGVTSKLKRNVLLGRPYLYFVRDVFSRMICGYYLGLQPPSELTAALALMSAFTSKEEVLREFGFDPEVDRWSAHHACYALLHDGGELTGHWGDWLVGKLHMDFEQTAAERGDLKGAVETLFHWSDVEWSRTTKGKAQSPRYRARNRKVEDVDLAAANMLDTIWEFERKVVEFILDWNNNHVLSGYDADADMVAAGVPRVPAEMFEWGIANRGAPRSFDDDYVRFHMMPREKVSVYAEGIKFQGAFFTGPELWPLQAEAARTGRVQPAEISHDLTGDSVLWHSASSPTGYFVCELADSHRWMKGLRLEDAAAVSDDRDAIEGERKQEEDRVRAERAAQRRENAAKRERPAPEPPRTRAETKAANATARKDAREAERTTSFTRNTPAAPVESPRRSATIHAFPNPRGRKYSPPSLEEIDNG